MCVSTQFRRREIFPKILAINKKFEKTTDPKKRPFFSLIALGKEKKWLCARGKGGGLAIWISG